MKKLVLVLALMLAITESSFACDICGCGVGSYYVGIMPEFNKKLLGMRYRYNRLTTHLGAGGSTSYLTTKEQFHTAELWGAWNLGRKFRVMAALPVNYVTKENREGGQHRFGLGDASLSGFYQVIRSSSTVDGKQPRVLNQSLWVGAGIKLPTGAYKNADRNLNSRTTNTFQLGTGSLDFTLNGMYDLRLQDMGANVSASYKLNTSNRENYQYGNRLSVSTQLYHKFKVAKKSSLSPNLGMVYEHASKDRDRGFKSDVSGGTITLASLGFEGIIRNRLAFGGNFQMPVSQDLAGGFVKAGNRMMVHVAMFF